VRCEACGQAWPDSMQFCGGCGRPLHAVEAGLLSERKVVTVLFCDLVGSTARADGADPEDVQAQLTAYHGLVRAVLEAHQGTVEKFIGDAVMAVFGAPVAHDDDAERAVRAALAILAAIGRENEAGSGLEVRIGIATGEVLVNLAARPELGEALVAGDVVNTAARLQTTAEPGTVVVAERTRGLTGLRVVYTPLHPAVVKGKAVPVERWRATGASALLASEAGVRPATRFVGREDEQAALQAAYERAVSGRAVELVVVSGEPGVGKSRLVAEFFAWTDERPELVRWRQGRCMPYGDQVSCYALAQIVKAEAGILDSDDEQTAHHKLARTVAALSGLADADRNWMTTQLAPLAGVAGGAGAGQPERFTAWRQFLVALAAEAPLVLVIEDLHWADAELLAFLGHLVEWAEDVPAVLLVTARPELAARAPEFGAEGRTVTRLALTPLSDADTAVLLASLLDASLLEAGLQARLLEQAGGNPLFAEQVVGLLTEQGALRRRGRAVELAAPGGLPVPDTLSALITARLDTLPRRDKALLGDAAVIGRIFWSGAVAALAGREEDDVRSILRQLAAAGFVARLPRSGIAGQAEYRFTHALVRDAAYGGLPRTVRSSRHLAVAGWLEAQAGDRGADVAEVVAHHAVAAYELAQARGDQAAVASLRAQTARRLAAAGERAKYIDAAATERHYARAVSILGSDDPDRASVLCEWGHASAVIGKTGQAQRALEEALALARSHHDSRHAGLALLWLGSEIYQLGHPLEEERLVASAAALLETLPPGDELQQECHHYMAFIHVQRARPAQALDMCQRVLEQAPADSNWRMLALIWRAWARAMLGDTACADDDREAIRLARQHGLGDLANALCQVGERLWRIEGPEAALAAYQESHELRARRGSKSAVLSVAASLEPMFDLGLWDEILSVARQYRQLASDRGYLEYLDPCHIAVLCWRGALAEARQFLDPVLQAAREGLLEGLVPTLAATVTLSVAIGDTAGALSLVEEYEHVLSPTAPASGYWGWCYLADIVRACIALGEIEQARRLAEAAEPALWRHQLELQSAKAAIAEATGDAAAVQFYAQAAVGWQEYGHVLEQGLALLGLGRCRRRASHPDASAPLLAARAAFTKLGAVKPLAEADRWLGGDSIPCTSAHIA
jgi:class 3 adenylate cyclase/tetratricopeptide (TPR) repeat protein